MSEPVVATPPATPTTPPTNGTNAKKFEGDGLPFKAKLIGMEDLTIDRDEKICLDSMFKLKAVVRARGEHKQRIQLNLTMSAVKIIDETTKAQIASHEIERISFVVIDPRDTRAFGYIYNTSDDRHQFWAIKTERAAAATVLALKELFELAFEQYTKGATPKEDDQKPVTTSPSNPETSATLASASVSSVPPQASAASIISPGAGSLLDDPAIWDTTPASPFTPTTQKVDAGLDLWGSNETTSVVAHQQPAKADDSLESLLSGVSLAPSTGPSLTSAAPTNPLADIFSTPMPQQQPQLQPQPQPQLNNPYGNFYAQPMQPNPVNTMPNYFQQPQQQRPMTPSSIPLQPQPPLQNFMTPSSLSPTPTPPPPASSAFAGLDILGGTGAPAKTTKESFFPAVAPKTMQQLKMEKQRNNNNPFS